MSKSKESVLEQEKIQRLTRDYLFNSPPVAGVRILSLSKEEISGDFHVVIQGNNSIYILVADGVGHGLSALMPGLQFPRIFAELASKDYSILIIASKLNDELCKYDHKGYFIALTLVQINQSEGFIEVLNCGNPPALLIDKNKNISHKFESQSLACGILKNENYDMLTERLTIKEKCTLYVFTDGIQDTLIDSGQCINIDAHESLYTGNNVFNSVNLDVRKLQSNERMDDITLIEVALEPRHFFPEENSVEDSLLDKEDTTKSISKCRILCIDPDKSVLRSISESLESHVRKIDLCATLDETFSAYQYNPDLIIIDLTFLLEYQSELTKILPRYGAETPIVVTCKASNVIVAEQLFSLVIARYLCKPIVIKELLGVISECMMHVNQHQTFKFKSSVFLSSSLAMTITDSNKEIIRVNDAFCRVTGYTREEVIGCNPRLLSSGKHDTSFYQTMWKSIYTTGHWSGEIWNKRKSGALFLEWITINAIKNTEGEITSYCSVFSDMTERRAVEETIKKLSYYDELTGLPNRRLFKEKLESELRRAKKEQFRLAVLFLDLDNFKDVNDTLGHDYGDLVLKESALRLISCMHKSVFLSRMGGDEFTICLTQISSSDEIDYLLKTILLEMAKPFKIKDEIIYLSVSIGVAEYSEKASDVSTLLKNADQAMFYAKENGRNGSSYFTPSMEVSALEKKSLIQDLRQAIKNEEFELYYQPIINMQTGQVYKAEALIRWHHPEFGLVPPDKFISIAESTGLIVPIGEWVFKQAVSQSKQWQKEISKEFQISINKSPKQFLKENNNWLDFMAEEQCLTKGIAIEITEGVLMASNNSVIERLLQFREKGIQISLDDFGTGYSSLAYLRKFAIDYIKIDRQFVEHLESKIDDQALCEAIIVMAHALGIKVVAEGIETIEQQNILKNFGCDYAQGYFYSKPIPAKQFKKMVGDGFNTSE
ncbi:MAG: EAL domain-containing protein [Piscirickettsiaceae bacterium]|nr:EAL domain-containing protein [Piscirickettsiaceae bacterium]